jgi:hypothetical protein
MKVGLGLPAIFQANPALKPSIHQTPERRQGNGPFQIEGHHLTGGVNPRVGATGKANPGWDLEKFSQSSLNLPLNRTSLGLNLHA